MVMQIIIFFFIRLAYFGLSIFRMKNFIIGVALFGVIVSVPAVSTLRLTSGGSVAVIQDLSGTGVINYNSMFAGLWQVNITAGVEGTSVLPYLGINSIDTSSSASGAPPPLRIEFSANGFGPVPPGATFDAAIEGFTQGSVSYKVWLDTSNALFGHGVSNTPLLNLGTFSGGAFSSSATIAGIVADGYSLTLDFLVTHPSGAGLRKKTSSFSAHATDPHPIPDGGATVILLGAALSVLGVFGRFGKSAD